MAIKLEIVIQEGNALASTQGLNVHDVTLTLPQGAVIPAPADVIELQAENASGEMTGTYLPYHVSERTIRLVDSGQEVRLLVLAKTD